MTLHSARAETELPAILGGVPVRPEGPPEWPFDWPDVRAALERAFVDRSWGRYHGPNGELLQSRLAEYHGCEHAVLCSSGTAAVELALRGLKIGAGDEVILAAYEFKANLQNVLTVGAIPVLIDVHPANWNMDVGRLEQAIGHATRAVLVTHLHGGVAPIRQVVETAAARGLAVIEDAAQMPGALVDGKRAGTWGDAGVLSFGGSKLLTAGRGGAVVTSRPDVAQRIQLYTQRGNEAYPLSELQAAVLLPQLVRLDAANVRRAENVASLLAALGSGHGLAAFRNETDGSRPGYYKLGFQYDPEAFDGMPRDLFCEALRAEGIAFDAGFRALHLTHSRRRFRQVGELPNATDAHERLVKLHHPVLHGDAADLQQIVTAVERIGRHAAAIRRASGGISDGS